AQVYDEGLKDIEGISFLQVPQGCRSNYYKYVALLDQSIDRSAFRRLLLDEYGVGLSGEVYETPCHLQPVFNDYCDGEFLVAEDLCRRHVCLPIYAGMTEEEANYVLSSLSKAIATLRGQFL